MSTVRWVRCLFGTAACVALPAAWAQTSGAAAPTRPAAPAVSPAAPAAGPAEVSSMERAQRLANNPMRVILEASRIRRKGESEEPETAAAIRRPAAATAPSAATAAAPAPAATVATAAAPVVVFGSLPAVVGAAAPEEAAPLATVGTVTAPAVAAPVAAALPAAQPLAQDPNAAAAPRLVRKVDPEVPLRVLDQLSRGEAQVELTIRPDGTVADVNVLPPAPRGLQRYVADALQQWRFEPLPAQRVHRVQLVFTAPR